MLRFLECASCLMTSLSRTFEPSNPWTFSTVFLGFSLARLSAILHCPIYPRPSARPFSKGLRIWPLIYIRDAIWIVHRTFTTHYSLRTAFHSFKKAAPKRRTALKLYVILSVSWNLRNMINLSILSYFPSFLKRLAISRASIAHSKPLLPDFRPALLIACSMVSVVSTP